MLEESRFDIGQRATPAEDSLVETETEMESNNREEETQKCRLDHEAQLNRTKISVR